MVISPVEIGRELKDVMFDRDSNTGSPLEIPRNYILTFILTKINN